MKMMTMVPLMIVENWNGTASLLRGWTRGSRGVAVRRRGRAVSVGQCGTDGNRSPPETKQIEIQTQKRNRKQYGVTLHKAAEQ